MGDARPVDRLRFGVHGASGPLSISIHARTSGGGGFGLHHHGDFAEVFWVSSGRILHTWQGRSLQLGPGSLQFIAREDRHAIEEVSGPYRIVNLAIRSKDLERWRRQRVFGARWPWDQRGPLQLDPRQLARLEQQVHAMPPSPDATDRLWLIAGVVREARAAQRLRPDQVHAAAPAWLEEALAQWRSGEPAEGVPWLARLAGRSREHVARTVRRHYAVSASALLNRLRCEQAAEALRSGDDPILRIAVGVGYSALGHFYRCFRQVFGTTPQRYRAGFRGVIGVPSAARDHQ